MGRLRWPKRSSVVFALGCAGFVHQVLIERTDRWALLALIAGLLGYPLPAYLDERAKQLRGQLTDRTDSDGSPPSPSPPSSGG